MDMVVRRGLLRDVPNRECRDKSILLGVTHTDPQAQVYNCERRYTFEMAVLTTMEPLPLHARHASANTISTTVRYLSLIHI